MTQEKGGAAKLSLNVRKMKFMQRCLGEDARRELEDNEKKIITSEHWELDLPSMGEHKSKFETFNSFTHCRTYRYGRMSFGGFNKAIEKLMAEMNQVENEDDDGHDSDKSISDTEMAERYSSLVGTIGDKYKTKSNVNNKKGRKLKEKSKEIDDEVPRKIRRTNPKVDKKGFMKPSLD